MLYKHILVILLSIIFFNPAQAQEVNGVITYNRKTDWISMMSKLPWITQEDVERDRLTWGKRSEDSKGRNYELYIDGNKSLYTYKEEESEGGYSWKKSKYYIIRDYKSKKANDWVESLGKTYRIEEEMPKFKWKILNEIREIEGYLCMKAETVDTVKQQVIHAWFTDAIPISAGPEGFGGLPGLILELDKNDGDAVVTATKIELDQSEVKLPIPKKMKGKEITYAEFNEKLEKYIKGAMDSRENPFWRIRY